MKLTAVQKDRATGVLLGTAAGDALAAGYEFSYPRADQVINMIGGGPFGFEPGEWTDDTIMALGIAQVTAEGFDLGASEGLGKFGPTGRPGTRPDQRTSATRPTPCPRSGT